MQDLGSPAVAFQQELCSKSGIMLILHHSVLILHHVQLNQRCALSLLGERIRSKHSNNRIINVDHLRDYLAVDDFTHEAQ